MQRIAPSQHIEQALRAWLSQGLESSEQPVSELLKLAAQRVIQEARGRECYERRKGQSRCRCRRCAGLGVPYQSRLMSFLAGTSDVLEYLVVQMYTRGLSTRDIEDAFRDPVTGELLLSRCADRFAKPEKVAASFHAYAYKVGVRNLPYRQTALEFTRSQLDRLKLGQDLERIRWGSKSPKLPPSRLAT